MKWARYLLIIFILQSCVAQQTNEAVHTIHTSKDRLFIYFDQQKGNLPFAYLPRPFYFQAIVPDSGSQVSLVTEQDSISFRLTPDQRVLFRVVIDKNDSLQASVKGLKLVPPATFSKEYIQEHKGKIFVEVPKVYELVNIIIAITPTGLKREGLVEKDTPYYQEVMDHFLPYQSHPIVQVIDKMLTIGRYSYMKMDSYSYEFKNSNIINAGVYNRVSWGDYNSIEEYIPMIEDFAQQTSFLSFYNQHLPLYQNLIDKFQTHVNLPRMKSWLEKNFPETYYDTYKIIFSPLAGANQSANHFESNGFREAQAHINFPYGIESQEKVEPSASLRSEMITFTELNHSYINNETEKHKEKINQAFGDLNNWIDKSKAAGDYNDPVSAFNEYMNWALVTLYYYDLGIGPEFDALKASVEKTMERRGFLKFAAFEEELLRLYRTNQKEVADLYPQLINWAADTN